MINIIGDFLGTSGYSVHTRNLVNALSKITDIKLTANIPQGAELSLNDRELMAIKSRKEADTNLIITHPVHWKMHTTAKHNWVYLVWEGDLLPTSFIEYCLDPEIEYIIVPSNHTKKALVNTLARLRAEDKRGLEDLLVVNKVRVINHGVDRDVFFPMDKPEGKIRFFANKGFRNLEDRGGIQYLINAWCNEFTEADNVELVIKLNPAYGLPNINLLMEPFVQGKKIAPIQFIPDVLSPAQLNKLYNQCHIFVSPTRAEAFNLPCLEALSCGLPVTTTNFGGQSEFVTPNNGWLIGGEMTEVQHELQYEGISWLTPNIAELRATLRKSITEYQSKVQNAIDTSKQLTWEKTAQLIVLLGGAE